MLTAHEEKMVFMAARLQENPTLTYEDAEALYHRSLGFTEADIARLQKRRAREIDRLKAQIDGGTYQAPGGEAIAEAMLQDTLWRARNECVRQQARAQRQDAGVVAAPSSELFVPAVPASPAPAKGLSLVEWAVIAFVVGVAVVVLGNACGLITTGGVR